MKVGDTVEFETDRMSFGPAAVGRLNNVVIFVELAAPKEKIKARLTKQHKNYWEAELVEILSPSPDRVSAPCAVFGKCGGCQWQHLSYPAQLKAKEEILLHQLQRATKLDAQLLKSKLQVHSAPNPFGYRARLQARGDHQGLGFYAPGTHSIVHVDRCIVAHPDIQKAWKEFAHKSTGQLKIEWTRTETGQVLEAINREHAALGFTQINPEQNKTLVEIVTALAKPHEKKSILLDLYGGEGNLSQKLTQDYENILCVDAFNSGVSNRSGTKLIRSHVENFLKDRSPSDKKIDCVIADPPRNGMREAADFIANLQAPRIVLVSCDPSTLARDLTSFISSYQVDAIHLVDMFPQTFHMEIVLGLHSLTAQ